MSETDAKEFFKVTGDNGTTTTLFDILGYIRLTFAGYPGLSQ